MHMAKTARGIYHNLQESEYTVLIGNTVYYFSSPRIKERFEEQYYDNRTKLYRSLVTKGLDFLYSDEIADLSTYYRLETRGFYIVENEYFISYDNLQEFQKYLLNQRNAAFQ